MWLFPNRSQLPIVVNRDAVNDELFISGVLDPDAVVLHRGPTHNSPDGEHCCVRIFVNGGVAIPEAQVKRRCVTFSEC